MTVGELIHRLGGELLYGDAEAELDGVADFDDAGSREIAFGENVEGAERAVQSNAGLAVVPMGFAVPANREENAGAVVADRQPRLWFAKAAKLLASAQTASGVHPTAIVSPSARVGQDVFIAAGAVIGDQVYIGDGTRIEAGVVVSDCVTIGNNCHIYPRVVIYRGTSIGHRVIVHAGAVLGADGFGYVRDKGSGAYTQFPQQGGLGIEDDVEIGANTTIDRGALNWTLIRRGTKIDNLVHIGHNCDIGEDVVIAAQTGISGSSTVGRGAVIAGQVGIGDHAHVGPGVILGGQAGVLSGKKLEGPGAVLWGTPAKPLKAYLKELATLARLARKKKD